ncbi:ThiF family adenylyltransferase [Mycobacterium simulans]|uniref:ThiF family adenylyltransferase n=1 Tax=Mycobacterium simulans TaxID=627089 RepID=UPI001748D16B|nr:ThiF family adenylyltransferase [Mycobacterium simulans]
MSQTSLPPLVEPAAELSRDEVARYSRHLIIPDLGVDGQKRLKNARVLVIGAGGLGSPALLYLAAAGVGTIGIVDFDVVDESNLQRQIIHGVADVGRSSVNYRDLYPEPPPPGMVPSCAEGGVLGIICASIASVMGTEAIKLLTGLGETLLGRLMIYDALEMTYRTIRIRKDPSTPKITELVDYEQFCGVVSDDAVRAVSGSSITPQELREMMDRGKKLALIDVREQVEWDIVHIDGAELIPKSLISSGEGLAKLPQDRTTVLYCKTGVRSAEALAAVKKAGFSDAVHLQGGIVAWAKQMQPDMVMY